MAFAWNRRLHGWGIYITETNSLYLHDDPAQPTDHDLDEDFSGLSTLLLHILYIVFNEQ